MVCSWGFEVYKRNKKKRKSDAIRLAFLSYQLLSGQSFLTGEKAFIWKKLCPSGPVCEHTLTSTHTHTHTKRHVQDWGSNTRTYTEQVIGSLVELGG